MDETATGRPTESRAAEPDARPAGLFLWTLFVTASALVLLTWIVSPESPSRFFRYALITTGGISVVVLALAPLRRGAAAVVRRIRRPVSRIVFPALLAFGLAEVSLRVIAAGSTSPLLAPIDATAAQHLRHWRAEPHSAYRDGSMNAQGYFDEDFVVARRPGVRRIVALADSFGTGVVDYRDNFLTQLEVRLNEVRPTEVLNFGIPALAPGDYLYLWRTEAVRYDPDVVLVCFFVGNDFDVRKARSFLHADTSMAVTVVKRLVAARGVANEPRGDARATFTEASFLELETARLQICRKRPDRKTEKRYESTFRVLTEMHETIGARLRIVVIPDEYQVNDTLYARLVGDDGEAYDRDLPQRRLLAFLAPRGVPALDLLPVLREAERDGRTYKPQDTHWNPRGNTVAADAIARWLTTP